MKVFRPDDEPEAAVIDMEDGTMPAYIPVCAEYAYNKLKEIEKIINELNGV